MENEKQGVVRKALIKKFEGASNKELMIEFKDSFRNVADMYSQFRSYLFALAKTHPESTLKLLRDPTKVVMKNVSRSVKLDIQKRLAVVADILEGARYSVVAEKHSLSIARTRGIFVEIVNELSEKHSLGIPSYYGKKQIIAEHKERLSVVISKSLKVQSKVNKHKAPKKSSPKRSKK